MRKRMKLASSGGHVSIKIYHLLSCICRYCCCGFTDTIWTPHNPTFCLVSLCHFRLKKLKLDLRLSWNLPNSENCDWNQFWLAENSCFSTLWNHIRSTMKKVWYPFIKLLVHAHCAIECSVEDVALCSIFLLYFLGQFQLQYHLRGALA